MEIRSGPRELPMFVESLSEQRPLVAGIQPFSLAAVEAGGRWGVENVGNEAKLLPTPNSFQCLSVVSKVSLSLTLTNSLGKEYDTPAPT